MSKLPPNFVASIADICQLIDDRPRFAAGLGRSKSPSWTGIPSYAELMSQVFDDLRARNALGALVDDRSVPRDIRVTITQFVFALDHYGNQNGSDDVAFSSGEWRAVEASARRVIDALNDAHEAGYELEE